MVNYRSPLICEALAQASGSSSSVAALLHFEPTLRAAGTSLIVQPFTDCRLRLCWEQIPHAFSYVVYRSTHFSGPFVAIASGIRSTFYVDTPSAVGTYYYRVSGIEPNYGETELSNVAHETTLTVCADGGSGDENEFNPLDFPMFIYYTLDGSTPTAESSLFTTPLSLAAGQVLKLLAVNGPQQSDVKEADAPAECPECPECPAASLDALTFADNKITDDGATNDLVLMPDLTGIDFSALTEISSTVVLSPSRLLINQNPALEHANFSALTLMKNGGLEISDCPVLASVSAPQLASMAKGSGVGDGSELRISSNTLLAAIDLSGLTTIESRGVLTVTDNGALTDLDLSQLVLMGNRADLTVSLHPLLTTVQLGAIVFDTQHNLDFNGNAFDEATVDAILALAVASAGYTIGSIDLSGGFNAPPSVTGAADALTLSGRGISVTTN